jgi:hypothetical protein
MESFLSVFAKELYYWDTDLKMLKLNKEGEIKGKNANNKGSG